MSEENVYVLNTRRGKQRRVHHHLCHLADARSRRLPAAEVENVTPCPRCMPYGVHNEVPRA